jgi:hypothetical protein
MNQPIASLRPNHKDVTRMVTVPRYQPRKRLPTSSLSTPVTFFPCNNGDDYARRVADSLYAGPNNIYIGTSPRNSCSWAFDNRLYAAGHLRDGIHEGLLS